MNHLIVLFELNVGLVKSTVQSVSRSISDFGHGLESATSRRATEIFLRMGEAGALMDLSVVK